MFASVNKCIFCLVFFSYSIFANVSETKRLSPGFSEPQRQQQLIIQSKFLKQDRRIWIRQPQKSHNPTATVVNLYVLDADWLFPMVASYIDYLSFFNLIPPTRIIGVVNDNRNRDFISLADPVFPNTGGGKEFQQFFDKELRVDIQKRFGNNQSEILLGHSFGGVAALTHYLQSEKSMQAYITMGTSVWVSNDWLLQTLKSTPKEDLKPAFLYTSVAEFDGGATVPKGQEFADELTKLNIPGLEWHFEIMPDSNHFSAVMPSLRNALEKLYPGWEFLEKLKAENEINSAGEIKRFFKNYEEKLGFRFWPIADQHSLLAYQWAQQGKQQASEALIQEMLGRFTNDPEVHAMAAYVAFANQQPQIALSRIQNAITLGKQQAHNLNRVEMYESVMERLTSALNSGKN